MGEATDEKATIGPGGGKAGKVCTVCGVDCTARPRTKDSLGRYVCKDCLDRAMEAKAATVRAKHRAETVAQLKDDSLSEAADNAAVLNMGVPMDVPRCPSCAAVLRGENAVLCTACGFDLLKGERHRMKVKTRKK